MSLSNTLKQVSIALASTAFGLIGIGEAATAFSITPDTMASNWSPLSEVKYNIDPSTGCRAVYCYVDRWAADNTRTKVPYNVLTNMPRRIGQSSSQDTDRYGAIVSDFTSVGDFNFTGSLFMPNDSDVAGLLWGFQDPNNHYRLSWDSSGRVKRVGLTDGPYERPDLLAGPNPDRPGSKGLSIVKEVNGVSTFLATNILLRWQKSVSYSYRVRRTGSNLFVSLLQGQQTLFSTTITDTTFMSGKVGFNTAGVEVFYGNTRFTGTLGTSQLQAARTATSVPEPTTLLGVGLAMGLGAAFKKKSRS
jgi:PEP-CTERM motif